MKYRFWAVLICQLAFICMSSTATLSQWMGGTDNSLADSDEIFYALETSRNSLLAVTCRERVQLNWYDNLVPVFQGQASLFFNKAAALFHSHENHGIRNSIDFSVLPIRAPPYRLS